MCVVKWPCGGCLARLHDNAAHAPNTAYHTAICPHYLICAWKRDICHGMNLRHSHRADKVCCWYSGGSHRQSDYPPSHTLVDKLHCSIPTGRPSTSSPWLNNESSILATCFLLRGVPRTICWSVFDKLRNLLVSNLHLATKSLDSRLVMKRGEWIPTLRVRAQAGVVFGRNGCRNA